jgi:hypothetical protein
MPTHWTGNGEFAERVVGHGGVELGTEGDSFYVVFDTAPAAVAAAAQAQRDLSEYEWPAGERVRVRIGIHTGSPTLHDGAYVGMDVHLAARVAGGGSRWTGPHLGGHPEPGGGLLAQWGRAQRSGFSSAQGHFIT